MYSCLVVICVILFVVASVTMLYWSCNIVISGISLWSPKGWWSDGLSTREGECHLDTDLFLNEYPWWKAGGPHHPFILHRMFLHATELGWKEMEQAICQGHWRGTPGLDPKVDVPTIQLMGYKTSQGEIRGLYNEVYQLKRLPSPPPCGPKQVQELAWDILSSMEEYLQQREGATVPERDWEWGPHYREEILQRP